MAKGFVALKTGIYDLRYFNNSCLLYSGGVVSDLKFHRDRAKVSGYMWGGSCIVKWGKYAFHMKLWHHGEDTMTDEEAFEAMTIDSIVDMSLPGNEDGWGNCHDAYWHARTTDGNDIYLNKDGWFDFDKKEPKTVAGMERIF